MAGWFRRKTVQGKPRQAAVDGVEYFRNIPEIRKKLRRTNLLTGNIWPVDEEEKKEWNAVAYQHLMTTSRIIGTSVKDMDQSSLPQILVPEMILSSEIQRRGDKQIIVGETAHGELEIEVPSLGEMDDQKRQGIFDLIDQMKTTPLADRTLVYNGCSSTLLNGKHRLVLAEDDVPLVERTFWRKLILIGIKNLGDITKRAEEEFAQSPHGILLRLRRISEKLSKSLGREPFEISKGLIGSSFLHSGIEKDVLWFTEKQEDMEDIEFVNTMGYLLLARDSVDPLTFLDTVAKNLAEDPEFRHEYRDSVFGTFHSKGITKLMFEMVVIAEKRLEHDTDDPTLSFEDAQYFAQAFQFIRELQDVVQRRQSFINFLRTGKFDMGG